MQASLSLISIRLESQNMPQESLSTQYGPPPVRSASEPSHFPNRMQATQISSVINDRFTVPLLGRERSLSPQRDVLENNSDFRMASLVQFELAAQANGWNNASRAITLACNLRGSAQALLSNLTPEIRQNYDQLVTTLTERFEPQNQCEIYKAQLKQRIRKRDEGLPDLAQDIKRLTRMAYPSTFLDLRDTLSKDSFIEALNDAEMKLFICQKEPSTIDDAVRLGLPLQKVALGCNLRRICRVCCLRTKLRK